MSRQNLIIFIQKMNLMYNAVTPYGRTLYRIDNFLTLYVAGWLSCCVECLIAVRKARNSTLAKTG